MTRTSNVSPRTAAACLLAGLVAGLLLLLPEGGAPLASIQWGLVAIMAIALGAWLLFSVWTWRYLARMRSDGRDSVYKWGVLGWGIPFFVMFTVHGAVEDAGGLRNVFSGEFLLGVLQQGLIMFPLALWGGYVFGLLMTGTFGMPGGGPHSPADGAPPGPRRTSE